MPPMPSPEVGEEGRVPPWALYSVEMEAEQGQLEATIIVLHHSINKCLFSTYCVPSQNKHPCLYGAYVITEENR